MFVLLILLLTTSRTSSSFPVTLSLCPDSGCSIVTLFNRELAFRGTFSLGDRQVTEIVFSCLATIFACTWVAVHPNLPGPKDSAWARFKRQLVTMVYALLAPEFMAMWAMRQRITAGRIAREYNNKVVNQRVDNPGASVLQMLRRWIGLSSDRDRHPRRVWTLAHGFFVQMGGFVFCKHGTPVKVLNFATLVEMIERGEVRAPKVSAEEIVDKSKGDLFTKLLALMQTTWFVLQCVARKIEHLPLTELEVLTLAFAVPNITTYALWWNKPQNVLVPVPIFPREDEVGEMERYMNADKYESSAEANITQERSWMWRKIAYDARDSDIILTFSGKIWFVACRIPYRLMVGLLHPLRKLYDSNDSRHPDVRVPMFSAGTDGVRLVTCPPCMAVGVLFGGLHLLSWHSAFLTQVERMLWRISALFITVEALIGLCASAFYYVTSRNELQNYCHLFETLGGLMSALAILTLPLYIFARATLVILAFTTLRSNPQPVFKNIEWISAIPHV